MTVLPHFRRQTPRPAPVPDSILVNPYSFYSLASSHEDRVIGYILGQHERGRPLREILQDDYVCRRCTPGRRALLLERPRLIRALVEDIAAAHLH